MPRALTDSGRVELRLRPEDKATLTRAATLKRLDLTGYILRNVLPQAKADIAEAERLTLSERDSSARSRAARKSAGGSGPSRARRKGRLHAAMTALAWEEVALTKEHERAAFDCGDADLDLYLQRYARQNHESGGAKCFVAAPVDAPARVLGFTTLSPASIEYARTPALAKKGLARYDVPVFRLGRLAVDRTVQGRGLGGTLLLRAGERCIRVAADVGGVALLIDAKNDRAAQWYAGYGALALLDAPLSLVLPLAVVADALRRGA